MATVADRPSLSPRLRQGPPARTPQAERELRAGLTGTSLSRRLFRGLRRWVAWGEIWARTRPASFAFVHCAALMALVFAVFVPGYDTNDDAVMNMIAAGRGVTLVPDEHLVFTNVLIGRALKALYTAIPAAPWYGIYLFTVHWLANAAVLFALIAPRYNRSRLRLFWCFFLCAELYFINNVQFTTTAYCAGAAGVLLTLLPLHQRWPGGLRIDRRTVAIFACAALLLILCGLIRVDAFWLVAALALPVGAIFAVRHRRPILACAACTAVGLLGFAGVWSAERYHHAYYEQDPEWAKFYRYNQLRVKFNDEGWIHYAPDTEHVFRAVDWSQADYAMMMSWFYDDPVVYSEENLRHVLEAHPWQAARATPEMVGVSIWAVIKHRTSQAIFCALPLLLFLVERRRGNYLVVGVSLATAVALLGYLIVFRKEPPPRVFLPILAFPLLICIFTAQFSRRWFAQGAPRLRLWFKWGAGELSQARGFTGQPYRWLVNCAVVLLVVGTAIHTYTQYRRGRERLKEQRYYREILAAMKTESDRERLFVCWSSCFPYESLAPLGRQAELNGVRFLALGWPQRTPFSERMKAHFGITDLAKSLYTREDIFQVSHKFCMSLLGTYVQEHYNTQVEAVGWYYSQRCILVRMMRQLPAWIPLDSPRDPTNIASPANVSPRR